MKTVKQEFTPVPKGAVRIIVVDKEGKRCTLQTTTRGEARMMMALAMYQVTERNNQANEAKIKS